MATEPDVDVDRKLRDVFGPDAAAVDRVAESALGVDSPRRRRIVGAGVIGLVSVVVATGLVSWLSRRPAVAPVDTVAGTESAEVSASLVDGVLVVLVPDDGVIIVGPGERGPRPSDGYGIVFVEGEIR